MHKGVPFKAGHIFQIDRGPRLANWPKQSSRKNKGIPTNNWIIQYGIKNAPVEENKMEEYFNLYNLVTLEVSLA